MTVETGDPVIIYLHSLGLCKWLSFIFTVLQIDKELASGEYFLKEKERKVKAQEERKVGLPVSVINLCLLIYSYKFSYYNVCCTLAL